MGPFFLPQRIIFTFKLNVLLIVVSIRKTNISGIRVL